MFNTAGDIALFVVGFIAFGMALRTLADFAYFRVCALKIKHDAKKNEKEK